MLQEVVETAVASARPLCRRILASPIDHFPQLNTRNGSYTFERGFLPGRGYRWAGFLAGRLWLLHDLTGDLLLRDGALELCRRVGNAVKCTMVDRGNIGFDIYHGICLGHEISGHPEMLELALAGADAMEGLYCEPARLYWQSVWFDATVSETPACLLPILWARRYGAGQYQRIRDHVHATLDAGILRDDGSVQHRLLFDSKKGGITGVDTSQGYRPNSTWARGQAWMLHSLASCLESFEDERIRDALGKAARWYVARMPEDAILYYDYDNPKLQEIPRDSCGTLIALIALRRCATLGVEIGNGLDVADRSEMELLRNYVSPGGVMLHGSWGEGEGKSRWNTLFPRQDVMPYGNYWLIEMLHRSLKPSSKIFALRPDAMPISSAA